MLFPEINHMLAWKKPKSKIVTKRFRENRREYMEKWQQKIGHLEGIVAEQMGKKG
jgi:hypothetical protein